MKWILQFVAWFNRKAKNLAIRLVKWTGKNDEYVHPKHLTEDQAHYWFLPYLKASDCVLDVGCGSGSHTLHTAVHVSKITGIDHNQKNLQIAIRQAGVQGKHNVHFEFGNLEEKLPGSNSSYSLVIALDILEHLFNRESFLNEIHRLLEKDGRFIVSVPNAATSWKKQLKDHQLFYYSDLDHKHEYEAEEIKELLHWHGFNIEIFEPTVLDTPWVGLIDIIGGLSLTCYRRLSAWKRAMAIRYPEEATGFRIVAKRVV